MDKKRSPDPDRGGVPFKPSKVFRFFNQPMQHQRMVLDIDEDGECVGVPYLATVENTDGFSYHVKVDLIVSGTGKRVREATFEQLTYLQQMHNLLPEEDIFGNKDGFKLKYPTDYNERCANAKDRTLRWKQESWVTQENKRIQDAKDDREAHQAMVDNGEISEDSDPEPDTFEDTERPIPPAQPLPYYYSDFIKALPSCVPLTFGFHVQVPHNQKKYGRTCYCPLSNKLRSWRTVENLDVTGDDIPYCHLLRFEDSPLVQHVGSEGQLGSWHAIVLKYLEFMYLDYNGRERHHKAFYSLNTRNYELAKADQFGI
jgi:hypothetical protein